MATPRRFAPSLWLLCSSMLLAVPVAAQAPTYDLIIRGGTIYDGSGKPPVVGDVAIKGDRIVAVGTVDGSAKSEVSATGMAVAPGFINMLSWATESLIADPKSESDIRQGVTLEVMGEGWSMGPINAAMKAQETARQGDIKYPIEWTSLGDYFGWLKSAAFRRISRASSAPRRCACMSLAKAMSIRRPNSWTECVRWCGRR